MEIQITDCLLNLDGHPFRFESNYLSRAIMISLLRVWFSRLVDMREGQVVYLPFSIDDEYIEAFEAKQSNEGLSLRAVKLDGLGFVPEIDLLSEEIEKDHPVVRRAAEKFLVCERKQLIDAVARTIAAG